MIETRAIPCLLLRGQGLIKTERFKKPVYLGDPINVVRIFNDKEVDELVLLDVTATRERRRPPFEYLEKIASECFMPLCYGGGVRTIEDMRTLFAIGIEKVSVNTHAVEDPTMIRAAADEFGSQSVIVSIDVKRTLFGGYRVRTHGGRRRTRWEPAALARELERQGAGELLLNSIDRDGTMSGYDLELVRQVTEAVRIPVVACGGAGSVADLERVVHEAGASAAGAGSMFVFQGPHRGVLISYPVEQIREAFRA